LQKLAGQKRARRAENQIFAENWQGADARRPAREKLMFHNRCKRGGFADGGNYVSHSWRRRADLSIIGKIRRRRVKLL